MIGLGVQGRGLGFAENEVHHAFHEPLLPSGNLYLLVPTSITQRQGTGWSREGPKLRSSLDSASKLGLYDLLFGHLFLHHIMKG
jgi:hypothetical protein